MRIYGIAHAYELSFQSPRDDIYGLLYTLSEMIQGRLPWSGLKVGDEIAAMKRRTPISVLFP